MIKVNLVFAIILLSSSFLYPQGTDSILQKINYHFQETVITQYHPSFRAKYSGLNSLNSEKEAATSLTSTVFIGLNILKGTDIYFNPELSGGTGLSGTTGIAGYPNGEVYRIGNPSPGIIVGRLFLRKTIGLGGPDEKIDDDLNQLTSYVNRKRITFTLGKFSLSDIFDCNAYSHDPRTQFMNWALMSSAAWDYPADTKGYTYALAIEYNHPDFALRGSFASVVKDANGLVFDTNLKNAFGVVIEFEKKFNVNNRDGAVRILFFQNRARMGNYNETINNPFYNMDITKTRAEGRTKTGFAINTEYPLSEKLGTFLKLSWNDGKNETWMFTEVDQSLALGFIINKFSWLLDNNESGIALNINGISDEHKNFLSQGGYGFIIGDGKLNYGLESIIEFYFKMTLFDKLFLTPDYQFVLNPAYNIDRGPVHIFSIRVHTEF
jgi:high affinity Mn2+ porin